MNVVLLGVYLVNKWCSNDIFKPNLGVMKGVLTIDPYGKTVHGFYF